MISGDTLKAFRRVKKLLKKGSSTRERVLSYEEIIIVFLFRGKLIRDIRDGLKRGCKDAGIPYGRKVQDGFTFHDLRHTAKTIIRKAGVDKNVRGVIFGHSVSGDMDFRHDHVDESDLLDAIDKTEAFIESVSQNVSQAEKKLSQN